MIPVDEAIGEVLKQATPLEAVTLGLADVPLGKLYSPRATTAAAVGQILAGSLLSRTYLATSICCYC